MSELYNEKLAGKWRDIFDKTGVSLSILNGKNQACPMCGGKDRFRYRNRNESGDWICNSCGAGDGIALIMRVNNWDFKTAKIQIEPLIGNARVIEKPKIDEETRRKNLRELWRSSKPITSDTPAGRYLTNRTGIKKYPACLRSVESMSYYDGMETRTFPGMIAVLRDYHGKPNHIHRTYLTEDGQKAPVEFPRRMMPGSIERGSAVRLCPIKYRIGVAEGIETAISATVVHLIPTWAVLGTSGMKSWLPPPGVLEVYIFGDNDLGYGGQLAAYTLGYNLLANPELKDTKIKVVIPQHLTSGTDWNDVWLKQQ